MPLRRWLFAALAALALPVALELVLQLLAAVSPAVDRLLAPPAPPVVPDERLGWRPRPDLPGLDSRGFRNPASCTRAQIVALGDSQTYGEGVEADEAWPRQLAALSGNSVYSLACGGYGPVQELLLWPEVAALSPEVVVASFYLGNDLFDAFALVQGRADLSGLASPDPAQQEALRRAEEAEPLAERLRRLRRMRPLAGDQTAEGSGGSSGLCLALARHSRLYGLLRRTRQEVRRLAKTARSPESQWAAALAHAKSHPDWREVVDDGHRRTVLASRYRLGALELADPRLAEGLQISWRSFRAMQALAVASRIRLVVVLLPTKEAVFQPFVPEAGASYRRLLESEARVRESSTQEFKNAGIECIDALPALQAQLAAGLQPYPATDDGHPNAAGQAAIARLVTEHLQGTKLSQHPDAGTKLNQ